MKILVVESGRETVQAVEAGWPDSGPRVHHASTAAAALARLAESDFDAILLDADAPEPEGLALARLIRGRERSALTPMLFVTADPEAGAGRVDFLRKPFAPGELRSRLAAVCGARWVNPAPAEPTAFRDPAPRKRETTRRQYDSAEERLSLLADASQSLLASADPERVLPTLLRVSRRLFAADAQAVWRLQPDGRTWVIAAEQGLSPRFPRSVHGWLEHVPGTLLAIPDIQIESRNAFRREEYASEGIRSLLCLPLCIHGEGTGLLVFYYHHPHSWTENDLRLATSLASVASAALGTAELYAEQHRIRAEAESARQRLDFLSDASRVLAASLELDATLEQITRLFVPRLADWCSVSLLDADGVPRTAAIRHVDPARVALAQEMDARYPYEPSQTSGVAEVLHTGRTRLYPEVNNEHIAAAARDPEHLEFLRSLQYTSVIIAPLIVQGRTLGALSLASAESGVHYTEDDVALAEDLASRAAMAIDNARLYGEAQRALEGTRHLMEHAHCLLWHAEIDQPWGPHRPFRWSLQFFDEEAAQRFLPLQLRPNESYMEAFYRSKPLEDRKLVDRNARAALEAGRTNYRQEYRCTLAGGEVRWLSEETHLDLLAPGRWRAVGVCVDITDRKRLEQQLRDRAEELADADERKDQFLSMLAHELRNPLSALTNAVHVMRMAPPDSPAFQRSSQSAVRQLEHQTRMVGDLLDVSRVIRSRLDLHRERLDLTRVVVETVEDSRTGVEAAGLALAIHAPPGPLPVLGDRTRLAQVMGNLLDNASKFTPPGGRVEVSLVRDGDEAELAVADTGSGIDGDLLPRVFDAFTQGDRSLDRSRGGLGLGLALVKGLVELHGGMVRAESAGLGRGARLAFRLPLVSEPPAALETGAVPEQQGQGLRILVVEDNVDAAETFRDLLELYGCRVELAHTGPEGVDVARRMSPEVVLCDIGLPGMDGYEVASRLRRDPSTAAVRLIAVTGYGGPEGRRRSEQAGFDAHLTKPVDPELLWQLLAAPG